jgi:chromosome segregation ATPase
MNAVLFDTHAFVKRLTAVGMPEAQAEVLADEQARLNDERLATKTDLRELGVSVKAQIAELAAKSDVKAEIADVAAKVKADIAELATRSGVKAEIADVAAKLKADIAELATKSGVKADIAEAKADILKWMFGTIGFQTLVLLGAAVALAKALH